MVENDLIMKGDVLRLIEDIKCDSDIPKNYGTLLDVMNSIRKMPNGTCIKPEYKKILTYLLKRYPNQIISLYAEEESVDDLEIILSDLGISSCILDNYRS